MIVIGKNTNIETQNNKKDSQQDTRIDSLQTAVDSLNAQISAINASIEAINASIEDKYSAQTQTLMSALTSQINALSESLSSVVSTTQVSANIGNFERLAATISATITSLSAEIATVTEKATVEEAEVNTLDVNTANVGTLAAVVANLETVNAELLNITSFVVTTLTVENLSAENVDAENIDADVVESDKVKTKNITGKEWHTPISTPNNEQLLHIFIPKYKGVVQMQTEEDEFNLTILNDAALSYNQNGQIIYRVERQENGIDVYLQNLGDTVNYRILHIGSESFMEEWSEIVYKSPYEQNVTSGAGTLFFYGNDVISADELDYLEGLRGNIQEQIDLKQNQALPSTIVLNGVPYDSVESLLEAMNGVLNGLLARDIIYNEQSKELIFPYNSIFYNSQTEELTVSGFNVTYDGENIQFSR